MEPENLRSLPVIEETKVTTQQFVAELKKAPEWAIDTPLGADFMKLHIRENGVIRTLISPDMIDMSETEFRIFTAEVRSLSRHPSISSKRLY